MKSFKQAVALSAAILLAFASGGCGEVFSVGYPGVDAGTDAAQIVDTGVDGGATADSGIGDDSGAGDAGATDGGGVPCSTSSDCPSGYICPAGGCVPGCNSSRDCPDGWKCDTKVAPYGLCARCIVDKDCGAAGFKCLDHQCRNSCLGDADCTKLPETPRCSKESGVCVACTTDSHCREGSVCIDTVCVEGCYSDRDCPAPLKCDPASGAHGKCFECVKDQNCTGGRVCAGNKCSIDCSKVSCPPERPVCLPSTGACVMCIDKSQCRAGEVCRSNACITGCDTGGDCLNGWHCKQSGNGVCVECIETRDCANGEICVNDACATGGCLADIECLNGTYCHPRLHTCEPLPAKPCVTSDDCKKLLYSDTCDPLTRTCIPPCFYGLLCLDQTRIYCDAAVNGCYECLADSNCPGTDCRDINNTCVKCTIDFDCINPDWHCDGVSGACRECLNNTHCAPDLCDNSSYSCVQCLDNMDCTNPSFPTCGKDKTCIPACVDGCVKDDVKCDATDPNHETYLTCGDHDNDPCLEYGYARYCPANQYCQNDGCICKSAPCEEGEHGCKAEYPTTVYECQKDSGGCLSWEALMVCTDGSNCGEGSCK